MFFSTTHNFIKYFNFILVTVLLHFGIFVFGQDFHTFSDGNILRLDERNDVKIGVSKHMNTYLDVYSFQAGFSPIKHLGITAGIRYKTPEYGNIIPREDKSYYPYKHLAIGGYFSKNKTPSSNRFFMPSGLLFDAYIGYGQGEYSKRYWGDSWGDSWKNARTKLTYNEKYIQTGIHYQYKIISLSMVLNYTYLRYTSADFYGDFDAEIQKEHHSLRKDNDGNIFKATFSFGYEIKYFKLALNVTAIKQKNSPFPSVTKGYYGLGASINIDEFFKKKKK